VLAWTVPNIQGAKQLQVRPGPDLGHASTGDRTRSDNHHDNYGDYGCCPNDILCIHTLANQQHYGDDVHVRTIDDHGDARSDARSSHGSHNHNPSRDGGAEQQ
jgi:hypothetical protein